MLQRDSFGIMRVESFYQLPCFRDGEEVRCTPNPEGLPCVGALEYFRSKSLRPTFSGVRCVCVCVRMDSPGQRLGFFCPGFCCLLASALPGMIQSHRTSAVVEMGLWAPAAVADVIGSQKE